MSNLVTNVQNPYALCVYICFYCALDSCWVFLGGGDIFGTSYHRVTLNRPCSCIFWPRGPPVLLECIAIKGQLLQEGWGLGWGRKNFYYVLLPEAGLMIENRSAAEALAPSSPTIYIFFGLLLSSFPFSREKKKQFSTELFFAYFSRSFSRREGGRIIKVGFLEIFFSFSKAKFFSE